MSRPRNNQLRRISIYALHRRPSFGFESSVSSTSMTSGDPVGVRVHDHAASSLSSYTTVCAYRWSDVTVIRAHNTISTISISIKVATRRQLSGDDLSGYCNKVESTGLRKCLYYHYRYRKTSDRSRAPDGRRDPHTDWGSDSFVLISVVKLPVIYVGGKLPVTYP